MTHPAAYTPTVRAVAAAAKLRPDDLVSQRKPRSHVLARWAVARLMRDRGRTVTEIGLALHRDHTTVSSMLRRLAQLRAAEHREAGEVARLMAEAERRREAVVARWQQPVTP